MPEKRYHAGDTCCSVDLSDGDQTAMKKVLFTVLAINSAMFLVEFTSGLASHSNSLLADSLDMLSDAIVYGITILMLSKSAKTQAKGSLAKGILMLALALFILGENFLKILDPVMPVAQTISIIGAIALLANAVSFGLLVKYKAKNLNVRSSWICSRNDMVSNVGVIVAGLLVAKFQSFWPDVVIGLFIATYVAHSAVTVILESLRAGNNDPSNT